MFDIFATPAVPPTPAAPTDAPTDATPTPEIVHRTLPRSTGANVKIKFKPGDIRSQVRFVHMTDAMLGREPTPHVMCVAASRHEGVPRNARCRCTQETP